MSLTKSEIAGGQGQCLCVGDAARRQPAPVTASLTLREFMRERFDRRHSTYAVVDRGRPAGLLHVRDVARHPISDWGRCTVGECTQRRPGVAVFDRSDDLGIALAELNLAGGCEALVLDGDEVLGVLTLTNLLAALSAERRTGDVRMSEDTRSRGADFGAR